MSNPDSIRSCSDPVTGVLDSGVLATLRELGGEEDPGLVCELIGLYLEDAPQRMAEIRSALATDDWRLLERAAHTLKSASANIGALGLSSLCKELETSARSHDRDACASLSERSASCLDQVEGALRHVRG